MSFSSFPKFQLFVLSGIHYCKHLTFVFVLCWSQGEQEGEFVSSSLPWIAGTLLGHVFLDLLMRDSFMYGEKNWYFFKPFWQLRWCTFKNLYRLFRNKKICISFSVFYLENGTYFSICAEKNKHTPKVFAFICTIHCALLYPVSCPNSCKQWHPWAVRWDKECSTCYSSVGF